MSNEFLYILGIFAAFLGFVTLEDARRKFGNVTPMKYFWALVGWYGVYHKFGDLYPYSGNDRLTALAFLFLGISPLLGVAIFKDQGKIMKGILRGALFLAVLVSVALGFQMITGVSSMVPGLILGVLAATLTVIPFKSIWEARKQAEKDQERREAQERVEQALQEQETAKREERTSRTQEFLQRMINDRKE